MLPIKSTNKLELGDNILINDNCKEVAFISKVASIVYTENNKPIKLHLFYKTMKNAIFITIFITISLATALSQNIFTLASQGKTSELTELLKKSPQIVDSLNSRGYAAIHYAAYRGHSEIISLLIEYKANINITNSRGNTPLHLAAYKDRPECVKTLVDNKANLALANNDSLFPYDFAISNCSAESIDFFYRQRAPLNKSHSFSDIIKSKSHGLIDDALSKNKNITAKEIDNEKLLHTAVEIEHLACINYLMENGASINLPGNHTNTPLHYAVISGNQKIIKLLINKKADIYSYSFRGLTPYHLSLELDNNISNIFVEAGYNKDFKPKTLRGEYFGQTPPDTIPRIFAPGVISCRNRGEYGLGISPDLNEFLFTASTPSNGLQRIKLKDNVWQGPKLANFRKDSLWEFEAFYDHTGDRIYFTSEGEDHNNFFFVSKTKNGFSEAKRLDSPVNSNRVMWCSFANNGTMYYGDNREFILHKAIHKDGGYPQRESLGINGAHPSIAPDENFMLFDQRGDIKICFKQDDGKWSEPYGLGQSVNTSITETCPSLSPDGKYIFFSRYNDVGGKPDIYWVSTAVIDEVKKSWKSEDRSAK